MSDQSPHPPELEEQMAEAVRRVGHRMADDFELMAEHIREQTDAENYENIAANLSNFVQRLMRGNDSIVGYLRRAHITGLTEAQAEQMEQEYVEQAMEFTADQLEDLVQHIGMHVPDGEWYSLAFDMRQIIAFLQTQLRGLRIWSRYQEMSKGPKLDDSEIFGATVWRNPDAK
jgi:hypothetical protein